jgi:hypothetical protein
VAFDVRLGVRSFVIAASVDDRRIRSIGQRRRRALREAVNEVFRLSRPPRALRIAAAQHDRPIATEGAFR